MNKYKILSVLIIIVCCISSCKKDFLEVDDTTALFRQSYVKNQRTWEEFFKGIYVVIGTDLEFGNNQAYSEVIADNLKPASASVSGALQTHYYWAQQADNDGGSRIGANNTTTSTNGLWRTSYLVIRACNFVIETADKYRSEDPAKADDIVGQAYAIRALLHFRLVNTFAQTYSFTANASHLGVPYITTYDISDPFSRQSVDEVYLNMIADLTKAIELLPENSSTTLSFNRNAVKALLARVYLFKGDYANAKTIAIEIATQFPLMTIASGYPDGIFKFKSPSQTEALFQIPPQDVVTNVNLTLFVGYLFQTAIRWYATNDVATILREDSNDVRKNWVQNVSGNWSVKKFPSGVAPEITPPITRPTTAYYVPIIRSSEMFLTVAEASAKLNEENTAREYLNAIRRRANPLVADVTATGAALLDSIYKERRKELCFESLRMYDLQRWRLNVHRADVLSGAPTDLPFPSNKAIAPIPLQDVQLVGIPQNLGY